MSTNVHEEVEFCGSSLRLQGGNSVLDSVNSKR